MLKTIKTLFVGLVAIASAVGCGGDDNNTPANISCKMGDNWCFLGPMTNKDCTDVQGTVISSCPSGEKLKCNYTQGTQKGTMYLYDQSEVDALKTENASDPCAAFASTN